MTLNKVLSSFWYLNTDYLGLLRFISSKKHLRLMLLLLLSHFSRDRLCVTPQMLAHQAPPSLGFSRQEYWTGLPFPSPMHESEVAQLCLTLSDPMDRSFPGSSIHGIFQARVLKWGAIAFSTLRLIGSKITWVFLDSLDIHILFSNKPY